jgi:hypothetical protein
MNETLFYWIVIAWIGVAVVTFPFLLKIRTPYGRHTTKGWGPMIDNKLGWVIMEAPSLILFAYFFLSGSAEKDIYKWIIFSLYSAHYINRSFIFPLRTRTKSKKMPVLIMFSAVFFNLVNGSINGYWLGYLAEPFGQSSLVYFIPGVVIFITGFIINQDADNRLIKLRKPGDLNYYIPRGGLFNKISCPNFFGEIVEWTGYAIMCWSLPALSFAVWTFANLAPRALNHHQWYQEKFEDYPKERKAVIPFLL